MTCVLTHEELAAWLAEDCVSERAAQIAAHVNECEGCRGRVASLHKVDQALHTLAGPEPPAACSRRALDAALAETRASRPQEVMTLEDVAAFLRIPPDDLEEVAEELPAFEIAGHVRVRRAKLLEWIERRERQHRKNITESELAQALSATMRQGFLGRG
jgi:hypothetical protein